MSDLQDFYPTPEPLIRRMLSGIQFDAVRDILEPSAGKGDICHALKSRFGYRYTAHARIDTIEIDPNLQHVLRGHGYNVVHDDFLTFRTQKRYDLIVANFPFGDGAAHLQKAVSLMEAHGGSLVCLVNAETIRNPYTNQRKAIIATLDTHGATVDYLSQEFTNAERRTNVEVALIRLSIPHTRKPSSLLDTLTQAQPVATHEQASSDLVDADPVAAMVARFDLECNVGVRLIEEHAALRPMMLQSLPKPGEKNVSNYPILRLEVRNGTTYEDGHVNAYLREVRRKYWEALIGGDRFSRVYTSNVLSDLSSHLERLKDFDFTAFNIAQLEADLRVNFTSGIEDAILAMFDNFSRRFSYNDEFGANLHYYNGWKSNAAHKINKKIILPVNGFSSYSWGKRGLDTYYITEKIADMVKAFNYLAGDLDSPITLTTGAITHANHTSQFRSVDFHYFTATFYKKGTCHITFKDQRLLDKLNIYGSQRKGWLPPSYGKRTYAEMGADEQRVVDEFQGEDAYTTVLAERAYYLAQPAVLEIVAGPLEDAA